MKSDIGLARASIIMALIPLQFCFLAISKVLQSLGTFLTSRIKILQDGERGVPGVLSSALAWMTAVACVLISPAFIPQSTNILQPAAKHNLICAVPCCNPCELLEPFIISPFTNSPASLWSIQNDLYVSGRVVFSTPSKISLCPK